MTPNNFSIFLVGFTVYLVYRLCHLLIGVWNIIINKLFVDNRQSTDYSTQQGRILWKQKHFEMDFTTSSDFLCLFNSRVKPESLLRPDVSLYAITNKDAFFCRNSAEC